jgi:hypothetical protein
MKNQERPYSLEASADEAAKMQEKIKSGEAISYNQAEIIVEREKSGVSVEEIRGHAAVLEAKIEATKIEQENQIKNKLKDREALLKEAKATAALLREARELLGYYESMRKSGELENPTDIIKLEELEKTVSELEAQSQKIDDEIDHIADQPKVMEKMQDEARTEDLDRKAKDIMEKGKKELFPQVEEIFRKIKKLDGEEGALGQKEKNNRQEWERADSELSSLIGEVKGVLGEQGKGTFLSKLEETLGSSSPSWAVRYEAIRLMREGLGMFKRKEKAALDTLLAEHKKFNLVDKKRAEADKLDAERRALEGRIIEVAKQYRLILLKGWDINEQLGKLTEKQNLDMVYELKSQLDKLINELAFERIKNSGKLQSEELRRNAISHKENSQLRIIFDSVCKKGGAEEIFYMPPKK